LLAVVVTGPPGGLYAIIACTCASAILVVQQVFSHFACLMFSYWKSRHNWDKEGCSCFKVSATMLFYLFLLDENDEGIAFKFVNFAVKSLIWAW